MGRIILGSKERKRLFYSLLNFIETKLNDNVSIKIDRNVCYVINNIGDVEFVLLMFMFDLETYYCYNYDSDFLRMVEDGEFYDFLLDILKEINSNN